MNALKINEYIDLTTELANEDPQYKELFHSLEAERKNAKDNFGYDTGTLEALLFDLWAYRIGYLLDHKDELDEAMAAMHG